jgi:undecaprenyl diphosphate synthase
MTLTKTSLYFNEEQLSVLDANRIPKHVAIIPDGNRRWAKNQNSEIQKGHKEGATTLIDIVESARDLGVQILTFYLFSTENWNRPSWEIDALMLLLNSFLLDQRQQMIDNGISLHTIGDLSRFPQHIQKTISETKSATAEGKQIQLIFALNYGGRDEIRRAFQDLLSDYEKQKIKKEDISEKLISQYLDTAEWPDPDLLIRTGGEQRVSNYMLWQISYTEFYTATVLWPDFSPTHLLEALINFQHRERRLGGT